MLLVITNLCVADLAIQVSTDFGVVGDLMRDEVRGLRLCAALGVKARHGLLTVGGGLGASGSHSERFRKGEISTTRRSLRSPKC